MRDNFPRFEEANATVLGLSPDKPDALKKWKADEHFPYDLLSDPEHQILEAWGAWGERSMYGKKYMGVIRSHWLIDENGVVVDEQIQISPEDSVNKAIKSLA
jgi:peroxiredoxin Q/BCP